MLLYGLVKMCFKIYKPQSKVLTNISTSPPSNKNSIQTLNYYLELPIKNPKILNKKVGGRSSNPILPLLQNK